jgi:hypothetical protein
MICRLHKINFSDQGQVTLQLRVGLSGLVFKIFCQFSLYGGPEIFFPRDPNPLSAAMPKDEGNFMFDTAHSESRYQRPGEARKLRLVRYRRQST